MNFVQSAYALAAAILFSIVLTSCGEGFIEESEARGKESEHQFNIRENVGNDFFRHENDELVCYSLYSRAVSCKWK